MTRAVPWLLVAGAGLLVPVAAAAQDAAGKTGVTQIESGRPDRGVFLDPAPAAKARPAVTSVETGQIARPDRSSTNAAQITTTASGPEPVAQLSRAELDATLAQLTPAERSVLLQAVEGTDICDNPPQVAAIITLCKTRIETRSSELGARSDKPQSAEERLLRGGLESNGMPAVEAVIARLARASGSTSSDEFSSQAIASVALTQPQSGAASGKDDTKPGLSDGTNAVINAIVQQLGGPPNAAPPPSGGR